MIYADHAATTPLSIAAREAMRPYIEDEYGNPSTLYSLAATARKAIRSAREQIAAVIGAQPEEIIFTSGGTESDNLAIKGTAFRYPGMRKHIITSAIEHHAVLHSCEFLRYMGHDVEILPVDKTGMVSPQMLYDRVKSNTILTTIMMANNEIGTIEPIHDLAEAAHNHGILFHTDAVQAVGHIPVNVNELGIDMLSASGHKFNGPKGVGFLYIRRDTPIQPLLTGGGQEMGIRSGTENVAAIVGMAAALMEHTNNLTTETERLTNLCSKLIDELSKSGLDFIVNGSTNRIPGSLSLSFKGVSGEMLLHRLDLMGICVATGSACNSKDTVLSHVIRAIEVDPIYAYGTIRITMGNDNDIEQVRIMAESIAKVVKQTKRMSN